MYLRSGLLKLHSILHFDYVIAFEQDIIISFGSVVGCSTGDPDKKCPSSLPFHLNKLVCGLDFNFK